MKEIARLEQSFHHSLTYLPGLNSSTFPESYNKFSFFVLVVQAQKNERDKFNRLNDELNLNLTTSQMAILRNTHNNSPTLEKYKNYAKVNPVFMPMV